MVIAVKRCSRFGGHRINLTKSRHQIHNFTNMHLKQTWATNKNIFSRVRFGS